MRQQKTILSEALEIGRTWEGKETAESLWIPEDHFGDDLMELSSEIGAALQEIHSNSVIQAQPDGNGAIKVSKHRKDW